MNERPFSHTALAMLAGQALFFLSERGGWRGWIDWCVLIALSAAVAWNAIQLARRLRDHGGGRDAWHVLRTLLFWVAGLRNGLPELTADWQHGLSWLLLVLAIGDTISLAFKERAAVVASSQELRSKAM